MKKKYNSVCTLAFAVDHDGVEPEVNELLAGLHKRLSSLYENPDEFKEACLPADDTITGDEYYGKGGK